MRRPTRNEYGTKLDKNGYAPTLFFSNNSGFGSTSARNATPLFTKAAKNKITITDWGSIGQWPTTTGRCLTFAAAFTKTISILRRTNL